MSGFWKEEDSQFLNYGYTPNPMPEDFVLDSQDEVNRAYIGLYYQAIEGLDLSNKKILEVGCGRGGGIGYIAKYHKPESVIGLDYSKATIGKAAARYPANDRLSYQWGDAEDLPFADDQFDYVLNIESSHCYSNMDAFVREATRVLKPGGQLLWADMRGKQEVESTNQSFQSENLLSLKIEANLTEGAINALDEMNQIKMERIRRIPIGSQFFAEFAGTKGSKIYKWLKSGNVVYLSRRYQKQSSD